MCYPRNDQLITELLETGVLAVDGSGTGTVWMLDRRTGRYRRATERVEQAGKRPRAAEYRKVVVWWKGRARSLRVHRIVWIAYHGATPLEIDHIDDDTLNCGIANLSAVTRFENEAKKREGIWARETGRWPEPAPPLCELPFRPEGAPPCVACYPR
jgi:hypothetical protein